MTRNLALFSILVAVVAWGEANGQASKLNDVPAKNVQDTPKGIPKTKAMRAHFQLLKKAIADNEPENSLVQAEAIIDLIQEMTLADVILKEDASLAERSAAVRRANDLRFFQTLADELENVDAVSDRHRRLGSSGY